MDRKIIHVDMDAFYASVEQRDQPSLRGRPVVVGGPPNSRGVVAAASYEARTFGVHSAMPSAQAYRRCPQAVFLRADFDKYKAISQHIRSIFERYTDLIQPLSLDEAYLDVTENKRDIPSATWIAREIRAAIFEELELTASAGVAPNKFIAKVASDLDKPNGLVVVPPGQVPDLLKTLPVKRVPGIGKVTQDRCKRLGIQTCADFLDHPPETLVKWFGKAGLVYRDLAQGIDPRPVISERAPKSCGIEDTFARDLFRREEALSALDNLAGRLEGRLHKAGLKGRTVTLKVKYHDFRQITRRRSLDRLIWSRADLLNIADSLLDETDVGNTPVRLLGISVSQFSSEAGEQLVFPFAEGA